MDFDKKKRSKKKKKKKKKDADAITIENPGYIRTGRDQMIKGGISDPRKQSIDENIQHDRHRRTRRKRSA